jgi:protein ImuB
VVEANTPQGTILWINEKARAAGIETGMRYAAGLSLAEDLRAGVVAQQEIDTEVAQLAELMRRFTPSVEPSKDEPGVFWLDAKGLERLFGSLMEWAAGLREEIGRAGFKANLVVGFDRFAVYALAKGVRHRFPPRGPRRETVPDTVSNPEEERVAARAVLLERLAIPTKARDALHKLGVVTLGQFVDLPLDGIGVRFGPEVHRLHRLASGSLVEPLKPEHPDVPAMRRIILDNPTFDAATIVALAEEALGPMLDEIARKGRALAGLQLGFRFERLGDHPNRSSPRHPRPRSRRCSS